MELKDKIKKLRQEKGMTQAQLAEALFVSRSTVAKWENGLGLPNADSMAALELLFNIPKEEVATTEPETVIVEKNKQLHHIKRIANWFMIILLMVISIVLPILIIKGGYGLTWDTAAGIFADNPYIETDDCRIYYTLFEGDWEDGQHWTILSHFKAVEKHIWGCTERNTEEDARHIFNGHTAIGRFYSIKGKNGYCNIIKPYISNDIQADLYTLKSVRISGIEYPVEKGFFFITENPVEFFWVGETFLNVA